jgi:hypothetical protein
MSKITVVFYGPTELKSNPLLLFFAFCLPLSLSTPFKNVDWCEEGILPTESSLCVIKLNF